MHTGYDPNVRHDFDYWTVDKLVKWNSCDLLELFHTLDAPDPEEMNGEFLVRYPLYREEEVQTFYSDPNGNGRGSHHLGKALNPNLPHKDCNGEGYNWWLRGGKVERFSRFAWKIGPSTLDGRPALLADYCYFDNMSKNGQMGQHDEMRRVKPNLYLCIAYDRVWPRPPFKFGWNFEENRSKETVFFLHGPVFPWQGVDHPEKEPEML